MNYLEDFENPFSDEIWPLSKRRKNGQINHARLS
jgi:hypothetical protein